MITDFEDTKIIIENNFDEIKLLENNFNEKIKGNFFNILIITIKGIKNLKICFEETIENKIKYLKKDEELLNENIKEINELDYLNENSFNIQGMLDTKGIYSGKILQK